MDDKQLREGVRSALEGWRKRLDCDGNVEKKMEHKRRFISKLRTSPIAVLTEKANDQHYEVPTEFFRLILGKRMKYSSCYFPSGEESLDDAEDAMLDLVCRRCQLRDGMNVMDLGCGWGATTLWILEKYSKCRLTCVSNSVTQKAFIEEAAKKRGFTERLRCFTADANHFETDDKFDRVISIEMFEHMKNYERLLAKIATWLKEDGMLFTQILCHREFAYPFVLKENAKSEWMSENFFSGGTMPSSDLLLYFQKNVYIIDHWNINGAHYSKTLEAWLNKLDAQIGAVSGVFADKYGKEKVNTHIGNWRMFLMYCSETFGYKDGNEWIVAHHLFGKRHSSKL